MCLVTEQKYPETLKKDLVVYKIFTIDEEYPCPIFPWTREYRNKVKYEVGKLYKVEMTVDSNFHTFHDSKASYVYYENLPAAKKKSKYTHVHEGFHSALTIERLGGVYSTNVIGKCIIPKGSKIYRDSTGLVVSNSIFIEKILPKPSISLFDSI